MSKKFPSPAHPATMPKMRPTPPSPESKKFKRYLRKLPWHRRTDAIIAMRQRGRSK